jgi:hypothetical protein
LSLGRGLGLEFDKIIIYAALWFENKCINVETQNPTFGTLYTKDWFDANGCSQIVAAKGKRELFGCTVKGAVNRIPVVFMMQKKMIKFVN